MVVGRDFSLEGRVDGGDFEFEGRLELLQGANLDAVDTLVKAVDGGGQRSVVPPGDVQNQVERGIAGLQRAGPRAFECLRVSFTFG